jgi:hypothetical protein
MIRMRVVKPDNVLIPLPSLALDLHELMRVDLIPILRRFFVSISTPDGCADQARTIIFKPAEQHTAALMGISFFPVKPERVIRGLCDFNHQIRSNLVSFLMW